MVDERDVGFQVRIINRSDQWNGKVGTLLGRPEDDRRWPVRIDGAITRHGRVWLMPDELERVTPPNEGNADE